MARSALSALVAFASITYVAGASSITSAAAAAVPTFPATPLASLSYAYTDLPYQVFPDPIVRGSQYGYNVCNKTTQGPHSLCQTLVMNNYTDFGMWGSPTPNETISDTEGIEVAYSTNPGWGTRLIPNGAIQGVQWLVAPNYIQVIVFIDQTALNLQPTDTGGELDGFGQDNAGNPMGGFVYTGAFNNNTSLDHTPYWTFFEGSGVVGIKICPADNAQSASYCQHTLDRIGIGYNMPNNAKNGTFEYCDSDNMDIPGVYTSNGQTLSYAQPAESLGAITTVPYVARIPASSNCVTFESASAYSQLLTVSPANPTSTVTSGASTRTQGNNASGSRTGTAGVASSTGSNGAEAVTISLFSTVLGIAFSVAFLA
ncbi:hypothetical protein BC827DRAFT_1227796 [Russula dissimulans]|nr:hypothetical protein BC827DRAFT_1227796 [Russula dissimulans]